jgi:hypothetical protein
MTPPIVVAFVTMQSPAFVVGHFALAEMHVLSDTYARMLQSGHA